jgi:hypothetical protein
VYVRRGSSTDEATPDEIIQMGTVQYTGRDSVSTELNVKQRLEYWHQFGDERFRQLLSTTNCSNWMVPPEDHHYQFSYVLSTQNEEKIPVNVLKQTLYEVAVEVRKTVNTGWSMFDPDGASEYPVSFVPESPDGAGHEVLERNLANVRAGDSVLWFPELWRFVPDGRATIVRAYREDRDKLGGDAGVTLSPQILMRELTELMYHAMSMANRFDKVKKINFRCSWVGLKNRKLDDNFEYWRPYRCRNAGRRTTDYECSLSKLTTDWSTIVVALGCPTLRLFGFDNCNEMFLERITPKFKLR